MPKKPPAAAPRFPFAQVVGPPEAQILVVVREADGSFDPATDPAQPHWVIEYKRPSLRANSVIAYLESTAHFNGPKAAAQARAAFEYAATPDGYARLDRSLRKTEGIFN